MEQKQRDSGFEMIRIISMLLIIGHHFAVHGGFVFPENEITLNRLFLQWLSIGGKVGVNLFVMLSGYFMITADSLRISRAVKLWVQICFYSVIVYAVTALLGLADASALQWLRAVCPILSRQWWFATAYFFLYLGMPWMNRKLIPLTKAKYRTVLMLMGCFWYVLPICTWMPERIRDVLWFVFLYCLSGYLRLHGKKETGVLSVVLAVGIFLLTFVYCFRALQYVPANHPDYATIYFQMYQLPILLISVFLFRGFTGIRVRYSPVVNTVASASLGVYLLHDSDHIRYLLWRDWLHVSDHAASQWMIPYALLVCGGLWLICTALELLRKKTMDGAVDHVAVRVEQWLTRRMAMAGRVPSEQETINNNVE